MNVWWREIKIWVSIHLSVEKPFNNLSPLKLIPMEKLARLEREQALRSPTVDQGQGGGVQMEKLTAPMAGQNLSVHKQIY